MSLPKMLVLGLLLSYGSQHIAGKLLPVDEARRDPGVKELRDRVFAVARAEDVAQLLALTADRAMIEEGEAVTRDSFGSRISNLLPAERTKFWYELRHTVSLGMAYDSDLEDQTLVAPYVWLLSDVEQLAITGTRVAVRERPDVSAPVIARLTCDVVKHVPRLGKQHRLPQAADRTSGSTSACPRAAPVGCCRNTCEAPASRALPSAK